LREILDTTSQNENESESDHRVLTFFLFHTMFLALSECTLSFLRITNKKVKFPLNFTIFNVYDISIAHGFKPVGFLVQKQKIDQP